MLEQALQPGFTQQTSQAASPANPTTQVPALSKPVSIDRPTLLSSSTMSDFIAWEEAWSDYAQCQHLASQDREARLSAVRSTLDEDIRRIVKESPNPDVPDVLVARRMHESLASSSTQSNSRQNGFLPASAASGREV